MRTSRTIRPQLLVSMVVVAALAACGADSAETDSAVTVDVPSTAPAETGAESTTSLDAATSTVAETAAPAATDETSTSAVPEPTTSSQPAAVVLPPDPLPTEEGATALATVRWEMSSTGEACAFLEFADAPRVLLVGRDSDLFVEQVPQAPAGEALVGYFDIEMRTGTSVVVEAIEVSSPLPDNGYFVDCDVETFDYVLSVKSLRPA